MNSTNVVNMVGEMAPKVEVKTAPTGYKRVQLLYEEYIHLPGLKQVWETPVTDRPQLEPCFAAAFHGIELAFLLMAEFLGDTRMYVAKRPRVEAMALDIRAQVQLLGELVDGELEEDGCPQCASLTQDFPFEGCPPTTTAAAHSPGLARLIDAVNRLQRDTAMTGAQHNGLVRLVLLIVSAFEAAFARWTVGLGTEHQFNTLLAKLGVPRRVRERSTNLDYEALVRPAVVEATLTQEVYDNAEDFFFRSVHLGTDAWTYVATCRLRTAADAARAGHWQLAASHVMHASRILHYLGDHILCLTRMNLRDYLHLKVMIEGTSGAGSALVRGIREHVLSLLPPLVAEVRALGLPEQGAALLLPRSAPPQEAADDDTEYDGRADRQPPAGASDQGGVTSEEDSLLAGFMQLYLQCDKHADLYNYAKALEDIDSAVQGGFQYKHYLLAVNVIGSEAKGTMKRAVAALKVGYETSLFPELDHARAALGTWFDTQLAHVKGRIMDAILTRYMSGTSLISSPIAIPTAATESTDRSTIPPAMSPTATPTGQQLVALSEAVAESAAVRALDVITRGMAEGSQPGSPPTPHACDHDGTCSTSDGSGAAGGGASGAPRRISHHAAPPAVAAAVCAANSVGSQPHRCGSAPPEWGAGLPVDIFAARASSARYLTAHPLPDLDLDALIDACMTEQLVRAGSDALSEGSLSSDPGCVLLAARGSAGGAGAARHHGCAAGGVTGCPFAAHNHMA